MDKDYYQILGVERNASDKEIRQAYRDLTQRLRSEINPGRVTQEKLEEINSAFQVLSDPEDRQKYDALAESSPTEKLVDAEAYIAPTESPATPRIKRKRGAVPNIFVNILMLIIGAAIGFIGRPLVVHQPTQQELLVQAVMSQTRHFMGNANAPVTIIEFADFQ